MATAPETLPGADDAAPAVPEYHSERMSGTQAREGEKAQHFGWRRTGRPALIGTVTFSPLIPIRILAAIRLDRKPSGIRF
jgi:hypothetical protein